MGEETKQDEAPKDAAEKMKEDAAEETKQDEAAKDAPTEESEDEDDVFKLDWCKVKLADRWNFDMATPQDRDEKMKEDAAEETKQDEAAKDAAEKMKEDAAEETKQDEAAKD